MCTCLGWEGLLNKQTELNITVSQTKVLLYIFVKSMQNSHDCVTG